MSTSLARAVPSAPSATGLLWLVAPLWYLLCEAVAAAQFPGYNYATFYISDLGVAEHGLFQGRDLQSQVPQVMNAGFLGAGLLFFLGAALAGPVLAPGRRRTALLVLAPVYAVGLAFVGLVQGSPSNVENGLIDVHVAGAVLAIGAGNAIAIVSAGPLREFGRLRRLGPALGALGLACAVMLGLGVLAPDGVWERGAAYSFIAWQAVTGLVLLLRARPAPAA